MRDGCPRFAELAGQLSQDKTHIKPRAHNKTEHETCGSAPKHSADISVALFLKKSCLGCSSMLTEKLRPRKLRSLVVSVPCSCTHVPRRVRLLSLCHDPKKNSWRRMSKHTRKTPSTEKKKDTGSNYVSQNERMREWSLVQSSLCTHV